MAIVFILLSKKISTMNYKKLSCIGLISFLLFLMCSCSKQPVDYSKDINDLKALVSELQHRSDSLGTALGNTNTNLSNLSKSVDSIKIKLTDIQTQIDALNLSLNTANANIASINAQLTLLSQQYTSLLEQLNAILAQLNSAPPTLIDGLVAFYPFSGNSGDSSGNGNHGTVNGATFTTDRFGNANKAYSLDGISNYFLTPDNIYNTSASHSLTFWYKLEDLNNTIQYIWNTYPIHGIEAFVFNWSQGYSNLSEITMCLGDASTWNFTCGTETIPVSSYQSNWVNMTFTAEKNVWKIFLNGYLVKQYSQAGNLPSINSGLILGAGNTDHILGFLKGKLDDIRIYNRVLTQSEITYLANH